MFSFHCIKSTVLLVYSLCLELNLLRVHGIENALFWDLTLFNNCKLTVFSFYCNKCSLYLESIVLRVHCIESSLYWKFTVYLCRNKLVIAIFCWKLHITVKPVLSSHSKRRPKIGFQDRLSLNAGPKYCRAILSTFIKLPFVFMIFVLSIFEWLIKTGFTVPLPNAVLLFGSRWQQLFSNTPPMTKSLTAGVGTSYWNSPYTDHAFQKMISDWLMLRVDLLICIKMILFSHWLKESRTETQLLVV